MRKSIKAGIITGLLFLIMHFAIPASYAFTVVYTVFGPPVEDYVGQTPNLRDPNFYFYMRPTSGPDYYDEYYIPIVEDEYPPKDYRGWDFN